MCTGVPRQPILKRSHSPYHQPYMFDCISPSSWWTLRYRIEELKYTVPWDIALHSHHNHQRRNSSLHMFPSSITLFLWDILYLRRKREKYGLIRDWDILEGFSYKYHHHNEQAILNDKTEAGYKPRHPDSPHSSIV